MLIINVSIPALMIAGFYTTLTVATLHLRGST